MSREDKRIAAVICALSLGISPAALLMFSLPDLTDPTNHAPYIDNAVLIWAGWSATVLTLAAALAWLGRQGR
jgi:hypothetical protein